MDNKFKNMKIEFHILQSFPVSCLNRDENGSPKTAIIGGVPRARVSSQCWKRPVRDVFNNVLNLNLGTRTKFIGTLIETNCLNSGATSEQAKKCADKVESIFIKPKKSKDDEEEQEKQNEKSDVLLFFSPSEIEKIVKRLQENSFDAEKVFSAKKPEQQAKQIHEIIGKPDYSINGLDIALFGRMIAISSDLKVEGAASFSHAISTHETSNEIDFFTALDDVKISKNITGASQLGSIEFNSATYYRYISLNLQQLYENLAGTNVNEAITNFIKAIFLAVPKARQASQTGMCAWDYAKIFIRKGQELQASFENPIKQEGEGYFIPSKKHLNEFLEKKEKIFGSLFGKIKEFTVGDNNTSIDSVIEEIIGTINN